MEQLSKHFKTIELYNGCEDFYHTLKSNNIDPRWYISPLLVEGLEEGRNRIGSPIIVNSGFRTIEHNRAVGGAKNSMHLYGLAADIYCPKEHISVLYDVVKGVSLFKGIGVYETWIHVDVRNSEEVVEWNNG